MYQNFEDRKNVTEERAIVVKKDRKGFRTMAGMLALCAVLSGGFGFAGGWLSNNLTAAPAASTQQSLTGLTPTAVSNLSGGEMSVEEVAAACADTVVEITTETVSTNQWMQQYVTSGAGSGVIISSDGYIITNNHVIKGADNITVKTRSGEEYAATLVGTDPETDIAVIKVEATGLSAAQMGNSDNLSVGQTVVAIGNPLGELGGTVTDGIVSALSREIKIDGETMTLLQTNAAVNPGNSGGGLFDTNGKLIGIVNAKSSGSGIEGLGFAIPINTAQNVASQLMENGVVSGRVQMGLSLTDVDNYYTAMQAGVSRTGVYVAAVNSTTAQQAGFQRGDCILAIDGTEVSSSEEVKALLKNYQVGDKMKVTVLRGNTAVDLTLTIQQQDSAASSTTHTA